jgi:hypothetical protein
MTKHPNGKPKLKQKSRARRLHFERCEERVLLATTPVSDLVELVQIDLNTIPADVILATEANDASNNAANAVNNAASVNNTGDQQSATLNPAAVGEAMKISDRGEGGFEPLRLTESAEWQDVVGLAEFRVQYSYDSDTIQSHGAALDRQLLLDEAGYRTANKGNLGLGMVIKTELSRDVDLTPQTGEVRLSDDDKLPTRIIISPDVSQNEELFRDTPFVFPITLDLKAKGGWQPVVEDLNDRSYRMFNYVAAPPLQTKPTIETLDPEPPQPNGPELALEPGAGEFVRLSVSTVAERIELQQLPDHSSVQIANASIPTPGARSTQRASGGAVGAASSGHLSDWARPIVAEAAWELQLTAVKRVVLAFDASDPMVQPRADVQREHSPNNTGIHPPATPLNSNPNAPAPTSGLTVPPTSSDAVSFCKPKEADTESEASQPYIAISPLLAAVAGAILVKDRWQILKPREEKRKGNKPR